jgi:hypothetical protein
MHYHLPRIADAVGFIGLHFLVIPPSLGGWGVRVERAVRLQRDCSWGRTSSQ